MHPGTPTPEINELGVGNPDAARGAGVRSPAVAERSWIAMPPRVPGPAWNWLPAAQFGRLAIGTSRSNQPAKPENLSAMPGTVPDRNATARFAKLVSPMSMACQQLRSQIQNPVRTRDLPPPPPLSGQAELPTN